MGKPKGIDLNTGQVIVHPPKEPGESKLDHPKSSHRGWIKLALRISILSLAILFFGLAIRHAAMELARSEISLNWSSVRWGYLGLSVLFGMIAMVPPFFGWHAILKDFGQNIPWPVTIYAYFLGHLGKYVPGKAMAVLLRVAELQRHKGSMSAGGLSVFVETLIGFASGGILGALILQYLDFPNWLRWSALLGIPLAGLSLSPYSYRWIIGPIRRTRIGKSMDTFIGAISTRLLLRTAAWAWVGWMFQGTALWFVLLSLADVYPTLSANLSSGHVWLVCVSSMSLGGLAGFLSMLPGGALARELASTGVLASIIPQPIALIATVLVRVTSMAAELLMILLSRGIKLLTKH